MKARLCLASIYAAKATVYNSGFTVGALISPYSISNLAKPFSRQIFVKALGVYCKVGLGVSLVAPSVFASACRGCHTILMLPVIDVATDQDYCRLRMEKKSELYKRI